ncbi:hypothetical protein [Bacteroides acidifaciens]|uniref:hypothetical protein n=1 Tax=Bacteroides acidifaciens TaxID=85831 RepID=UPI002149E09E|nr:hypothetical protein [Bacteroides acidifaciens]MCR2007997.1 hypothetical protein [Bacteroides acidifaciens]
MADISAEQHRINRINELLDRLDKIPGELDAIHERLYAGNLDRNEFAGLIDRRTALFIEQENKERELKEVYKIKL